MESELLKFKHVLEYFVTHQNYLSSNSSVSVRGYDQYLKSFIEKHNFSMTGQGYNDGRIQNQIGEWDNIYSHQICLNIQPNYGNYESKKSYLNWRGTGLNIFCEWENSEVKALSIGYAYWWLKPTQYDIILTRTISELKLYEETDDNSLLKEFFDIFVKEINNYDTQKGQYYLKEQEYYRQEKQDKNMKKNREFIDIVVSKYNLILTGAPGTGKTYLAKQIAAQMILGKEFDEKMASDEEKEKMKEQYGFAQFHPSYDYTDFVEGLRPLSQENEKIGFERKDGIFKAFCVKALKYSFDKAYDKLIEDIRKGKVETIELKTKNSSRLSVTDGENIHWYSEAEANNISSNAVSRLRLKNLYKQYYTLDKLETISNIQNEVKDVIGGCDATYYWGVLHYLLKQYIKPFVFVIDEINRGEISKIFGELFYSIDPGYRGKKGKVNTQYQNLIPKEGDKDFNPNCSDAFRNGFYVPENIYIIGTMNDIDRSVESMDFAFRRRFAFMDIKADENTGMLDNLKWKDEAIERMKRLNAEIEKIEGLSSAYHIGASYFLKLENYNGDFGKLWEYHLKGLLFEYLRGMQSVETKIEQLKEAYENESNPNN